VTHDWTKEKLKNTGWPLYGFFWDMADLGQAKIEVKKLPASKNPNKLVPVKVEQPVQPKGNKVSPISGRK
jgi:hypothetical protein